MRKKGVTFCPQASLSSERIVTTPESNAPANSPDDAAMDHQVRVFLEGRSLIQAHIRSLVRDAAMAEDVFQEVWLRFERVTRHGEIIGNVPAW